MRLCISFLLNKLSLLRASPPPEKAAVLPDVAHPPTPNLPTKDLGAIVGSEGTPTCIDADAVNNYINRKRLFELSCWFNLSNVDFDQHSRAETGFIIFFEIKIIIAAGKVRERLKKNSKTLCIINKLFNKHFLRFV